MEGPKINENLNLMGIIRSQKRTYNAVLCNNCKSSKCFICSKPINLGKDAKIG